MLRYLAIPLIFCLMLPFQNCGPDYTSQQSGLFVGDDYDEDDCLSEVVDCGPQPSFLEITLDLADPSVFFTDTTSFTVSGRCNSGNYAEHYVHWELRDNAGAVVNTRDEAEACVKGLYSFTAPLKTSSNGALTTNALYTLYVNIVGMDEYGGRYSNLQANGSAQIDFSVQTQ